MSALSIDVVDDDTRLPALADEWSALLADTPEASGFHSLAWISACRSVLPPHRSLFVLVIRESGGVIAILPTEMGAAGDLQLIGQGRLSNYLGPVYRAANADMVVDALGSFLARERRSDPASTLASSSLQVWCTDSSPIRPRCSACLVT